MATARTIVNAVIGALVAVVLSFVPLSPALGGLAAGFLEGPESREGLIAGTVAGLFMFIPFALFGMVFMTFFGIGFGFGVAPASGLLFVLLVFGSIVFGLLVYVVGLSMLGGLLGSYLAREYPRRHERTRRTIGMDGDAHRQRRPADSSVGPSARATDGSKPRSTQPSRDRPPLTDQEDDGYSTPNESERFSSESDGDSNDSSEPKL